MDNKASAIRFACAAAIMAAADAALTLWLLHAGQSPYAARGIALLVSSIAGAALFTKSGFRQTWAKESRVFYVAASLLDFVIFWKILRLSGSTETAHVLLALTGGLLAASLLKYLMFKSAFGQQAETGAAQAPSRHKKNLRLAVWLVITSGIAWRCFSRQLDLLAGRAVGPSDPDTWLRLAQVRQWVTGGGFYNHVVANTNTPYGGIEIHWTRPMDALLSVLYAIAPYQLDLDAKMMFAANWLPGLLYLAAIYCMAKAARFQAGGFHTLTITALLVFFGTLSATQYSPGNADHHGILCLLWCAALALVFSPPDKGAAVLLGLVLGLAVWISPEALLPVACIVLLLWMRTLKTTASMGSLAVTAVAATVVTAAGVLVERPSAHFSRAIYDQLSIVHVSLYGLCAAAASVMAVFYKRSEIRGRVLSALLAATAIMGMMVMLYPKFFRGPFAESDPYVTDNLLPAILQAQPLFDASFADICRTLILPFSAVILMGSCCHKGMTPAKKRYMTALAALLSLWLGMTLWQLRWQYYMQPVAIIIIASLLPAAARAARPRLIKWLKEFPALWRPYMVLWVIILSTMGIGTMDDRTENAACGAVMRAQIQQGWLERRLGSKPLGIAAPADVSGQLLFFTPYNIIAGNYHREAAGLRDMDTIWDAGKAEDARKKLRERNIRALFYCPSAVGGKSWLSGKKPAWLTPIADDTTLVYMVK